MADSDKSQDSNNIHEKSDSRKELRCFHCNVVGHYASVCPDKHNQPTYHFRGRMKRSTGIPKCQMTLVDAEVPGAMLTSSGDYAMPTLHYNAYVAAKSDPEPGPPPPVAIKRQMPEQPEEKVIPSRLLCLLCRDLLDDAVMLPCCAKTCCQQCVKDSLDRTKNSVCPLCKETDITVDLLSPNRQLRKWVTEFINDSGYTRAKRSKMSDDGRRRRSYTDPGPSETDVIDCDDSEGSDNVATDFEVYGGPEPDVTLGLQPDVCRLPVHVSPPVCSLPAHLIGMPPQVVQAALKAGGGVGRSLDVNSIEAHTGGHGDHQWQSVNNYDSYDNYTNPWPAYQ